MQRWFGSKPKNSTITYRNPYPSWYDQVVLPPWYRIPHFVKFTRTGSTSTMEHISQYLAQLGELSDEPVFRVWFFPLSLSSPAFSWFASLPYDSIVGWEDLESKFHQYFDLGVKKRDCRFSRCQAGKQRIWKPLYSKVQRCWKLVLLTDTIRRRVGWYCNSRFIASTQRKDWQ
jgi:hypothetical protein